MSVWTGLVEKGFMADLDVPDNLSDVARWHNEEVSEECSRYTEV